MRDRAIEVAVEWTAMLEATVREAQDEGAIGADEDPEQLVFELDAYLLLANAHFVIAHDPARARPGSACGRPAARARGHSLALKRRPRGFRASRQPVAQGREWLSREASPPTPRSRFAKGRRMLLYIARRLAWTVLIVLVALFITFLVFFKLPAGDPAAGFAGPVPTEESLALVRERLHFDEPIHNQFGYFVWHFVRGDENGWPGLGYSYIGSVPVKDQIAHRAPRTLWLVAGAATLWLVLGVAIGVLSAVKRRSIFDRLAMGLALFGMSAPIFWLGAHGALDLLARARAGPAAPATRRSPTGVGEWFSHLILPWSVLALVFAAIYARMTRNTLLETLGEDYIRTARAKGLSGAGGCSSGTACARASHRS